MTSKSLIFGPAIVLSYCINEVDNDLDSTPYLGVLCNDQRAHVF